jgi:signal transduction histidine kinase
MTSKSTIPIKVIFSYIILTALICSVGWILYDQNKLFSNSENSSESENNKILKVSNLLSSIYKTESLSRKSIFSNLEQDFTIYSLAKDSLNYEINELKQFVTSDFQVQLLDSVQLLLTKKTENIKQLKAIRNKKKEEVAVKKAITKLTKMEASLEKLRVEDFTHSPKKMGNYQRSVLEKYVAYLNQNIPDDSTNTLSKKVADSILASSKKMLNRVKNASSNQNQATIIEEKKLFENDILISDKLIKILKIVEREIILNTSKNEDLKQKSLKKINAIVTIAAIIGFLLTVFFSILILNDFSNTQKYKSQLEIANQKTQKLLKNREQLIATVSHDLKTPLSTIVGYTELLGNSELTKKQHYFAQNIRGSSEYITNLVQDLLDFTQIEAGKITVENIPFSLHDLIVEVANSIQSIYAQKPIELNVTIDPKFGNKIIGDPFRLKQVVTNIIGNAYKFTESGFIKIDVEVVKLNLLQIKIEDSGIGIAKNKQQLIFDEFTQADDAIEKKYGGTGLGLTISKKIIEILGGKLALKSEIDNGSQFAIVLPLQFDKSVENQIVYKKLTAIVVDDDESLLNLTSEVLKMNNYQVHAYLDAKSALEASAIIDFDLVITDIQMPEIDGFQFLEHLKKSKNYKNQPIFALTGRTDLDATSYQIAGFSKVILKPYLPKNLISILNNSEIIEKVVPSIYNSCQLFSLALVRQFLPENDTALNDFLVIVKQTSGSNLQLLEKAFLAQNPSEIKIIAHRMNPVFKQIQAVEISEILDDLENNDFTIAESEIKISYLKSKIEQLFLEIKTT